MIKKYAKWFLGLSAAIALSGCGLFETDSAFSPARLTTFTATAQAKIVWDANIGRGGGYGFIPSVVGQSVFTATPNGYVSRIDLKTGQILWKVDLDTPLAAGAASDGQIVVVSTQDGRLVALDAKDGKERWRATPSTEVSIPALVAQGQVVVRADDYRVQAFNAQTGKLSWVYLRATPNITLRGSGQLALQGQNVLVGQPIGHLVALNIQTGSLVWDQSISNPQGGTSLGSVTDIAGEPLVLGNTVCVSSYQGNLACTKVVKDDANLSWKTAFSSAVGIGHTSDTLYVAGLHGELRAMALKQGGTQWENQVLANRGLTNVAPEGDYLVVGDYSGYLQLFNRKTGQLVGRYFTGSHRALRSTFVPTDSGVLVQTPSGNLLKVRVVPRAAQEEPLVPAEEKAAASTEK